MPKSKKRPNKVKHRSTRPDHPGLDGIFRPMREMWTVDDVAEIQGRMDPWAKSEHGRTYIDESGLLETLAAVGIPEEYRRCYLGYRVRETYFSDLEVTWASPEFCDTTEKVASDAPVNDPLQPHEFIADRGLFVFSKDVELPGIEYGVRAISWDPEKLRMPNGNAVNIQFVTFYRFEQSGNKKVFGSGKVWKSCGLLPTRLVVYVLDSDSRRPDLSNPDATRDVIRILRSISALSRASITGSDQVEVRPKRSSSRSTTRPVTVRRSYLNKPEIPGSAKGSSKSGRVVKGHDVRSHWRRVWYASLQIYEWRVVTKYLRGDFTKGEVTGQKVLVARADDISDDVLPSAIPGQLGRTPPP